MIRFRVLVPAVALLAAVGCSAHRSIHQSVGPGSTPTVTPTHPGSPKPRATSTAAPTSADANSVTRQLLGLPPVPAGSRLPGYLLIADRDNNRLIVVSPSKKVVWKFPKPGEVAPGDQFAGPDDAFITPDKRHFITNEEFADTIALIKLGAHPKIAWEYGHANQPGSAAGYLAHPDDAYVRPNGLISSADIENCRVLWIDHAGNVVHAIGHAGDCAHNPPYSVSSPNGDTPLPDGGTLVTEIGGWVDRFNAHRQLMWSMKTPTTYPSDAQLLPDGNVLVAGFNLPGRVDIIKPNGHIVWTYMHSSGPGELNQPSLAVALPNGTIAVTDDWNHRVVLIDRKTKKIVWQYGHDHQPGSAPGYLNKPDGLDLIP